MICLYVVYKRHLRGEDTKTMKREKKKLGHKNHKRSFINIQINKILEKSTARDKEDH